MCFQTLHSWVPCIIRLQALSWVIQASYRAYRPCIGRNLAKALPFSAGGGGGGGGGGGDGGGGNNSGPQGNHPEITTRDLPVSPSPFLGPEGAGSEYSVLSTLPCHTLLCCSATLQHLLRLCMRE